MKIGSGSRLQRFDRGSPNGRFREGFRMPARRGRVTQ
jgi:hypothetical protein